jgi:hypothetical protein
MKIGLLSGAELCVMKGYMMGKAAIARGILIQRIPEMAPNDMKKTTHAPAMTSPG